MKINTHIILAFALAACAAPAWAEKAEVLDFVSPTVQGYYADGTLLPKRSSKSEFTNPYIVSAQPGPGNSVGLTLKSGAIVYVRRMELRLKTVPCLESARAESRDGRTLHAGDRMGAGDSPNCKIDP